MTALAEKHYYLLDIDIKFPYHFIGPHINFDSLIYLICVSLPDFVFCKLSLQGMNFTKSHYHLVGLLLE